MPPVITTSTLDEIAAWTLDDANESVLVEGLLYHWTFDVAHGSVDRISGVNLNYYDTNLETGAGDTKVYVDAPLGRGVRSELNKYWASELDSVINIGTSDFSVLLWVRTLNNPATSPTIISYRPGGNGTGWAGFMTGTDTYRFRVDDGVDTAVNTNLGTSPAGAIDDNTNWRHMAWTIDRDDLVNGYLDAQACTSPDTLSSNAGALNAANRLCLGTIDERANLAYGDFEFADVRIYNTALSAAEVAAVYARGVRGLASRRRGLFDPSGRQILGRTLLSG